LNVTVRLSLKLAVPTLVLVIVASACDSSTSSSDSSGPSNSSAGSSAARPLRLAVAPTPPLPVRRYDTGGKYPQVRDGTADLEAVNAALRKAVVDDQRTYAPYARRQKPRIAYSEHGVYRTAVDRKLISASTVVVSVLMPATRELFPGQHGGDAWLGITVRVPSGARVRITDVFANPERGLRVLATAARGFIQRTEAAPCVHAYAVVYGPTAENYRAFALTPTGLAVGFPEVGACYRLVATVPYATLRSYLSPLGARLVDGVRVPAESRKRQRRSALFGLSRRGLRGREMRRISHQPLGNGACLGRPGRTSE
jgi:hypothetical protein